MSADPISTAEAKLDAMVSDTFGAKKGTLAQKLRKGWGVVSNRSDYHFLQDAVA